MPLFSISRLSRAMVSDGISDGHLVRVPNYSESELSRRCDLRPWLLALPGSSATSRSRSAISATRRACRPPSNAVARKVCRIDSARAAAMTRPPIARTLASLCRRAISAIHSSWHARAARSVDFVGGDLFALPAAAEHHTDRGIAADDGAGGGRAQRWVVDGLLGCRAEIDHFVAGRPCNHCTRCCFSAKPAWSTGQYDVHCRAVMGAPNSAKVCSTSRAIGWRPPPATQASCAVSSATVTTAANRRGRRSRSMSVPSRVASTRAMASTVAGWTTSYR